MLEIEKKEEIHILEKKEKLSVVKVSLNLAWKELLKQYEQKNKKMLLNFLQQQEVPNHTTEIKFITSSPHIASAILEDKSEILFYLKSRTKLDVLEISVELIKLEESTERMPYTNKEFFEAIFKLNPEIVYGLKELGMEPK